MLAGEVHGFAWCDDRLDLTTDAGRAQVGFDPPARATNPLDANPAVVVRAAADSARPDGICFQRLASHGVSFRLTANNASHSAATAARSASFAK